jgi:TRAP-type C4-dicarboxylate transport system permease small subunit
MQFLPLCILTWVIFNVASTISPFELNPGFFRWGYALPGHEVYQVLIQIWSDGCQDQSYLALPILFAWWILGLVAVIYANYHRCQVALKAQSELEAAKNDLKASSSTDDILERERRYTGDSIRLERVYGPSYPTPGVHGAA